MSLRDMGVSPLFVGVMGSFKGAAGSSKFIYKRHEPEKTLLYQVMAENLETWLSERQADSSRTPLPHFVEKELRDFMRCGLLNFGFTLVHCEDCGTDLPVAFSCKHRGFCPSCGTKRMSETAVHLIDNVLPHAPYRQWVTTFPHSLRFWMATSRKLTGAVHKIVARMIMHYYEYQAEERRIKDVIPGGMTFIQRFGSALNLNVHFHSLTLDGVFSTASGKPVFYHLPGPSNEEVADVVQAIAHSVIEMLKKKQYLSEDGTEVELPDDVDKIFSDSEQLTAAASASNLMRVAFGERAGQKVRRIGSGFGYENELPLVKGPRCFSVNGFTVHANRYIGQQERTKLERLIGYAARPAFSHKRLSLQDPTRPDGDLKYELKTQWADGTQAIILSRMELIEKLAALIPPPYLHLTRYFGIFSSNNKWRRKIILKPHVKKGFVASYDEETLERMSWSELLRRVFRIDIEKCQICGGKIRPEGCTVVVKPQMIIETLKFLGISYHPPPIKSARFTIHELNFDQRPPHEDDLSSG